MVSFSFSVNNQPFESYEKVTAFFFAVTGCISPSAASRQTDVYI